MNERLLQFIWQFQYFNKKHLQTQDGEPLEILVPGQFNPNQGPDFLNARIKIGSTILAGNIELHLAESDWSRHSHNGDPNYRNIILHVLWEPPERVTLELPTIFLKDRVFKILLQRYGEFMQSKAFVPCADNLNNVTELTWMKWKERLLAERLLRKGAVVEQYLQQSNQHWEEVFWWMLARSFGITVNADAFEAMARSLPLTLLGRHRNHIHQLEALLLGQAGILTEGEPLQIKRGQHKQVQNNESAVPDRKAAAGSNQTQAIHKDKTRIHSDQTQLISTRLITNDVALSTAALSNKRARLPNKEPSPFIKDEYTRMLLREYGFYKKKYKLNPIRQQVQFLRMRPGNFPTVRIAQLAMLLHTSVAIFSQAREMQSVEHLYKLLRVTASEYWHTHYLLGEETVFLKKTLGSQMIENIIINTITPVLFMYGQLRNEQQYKDKALDWLAQLAPEKNSITNQWVEAGVQNRHAWDSQALIELKKEYCDVRRCLECAAGNSLFRGSPLIPPRSPAS